LSTWTERQQLKKKFKEEKIRSRSEPGKKIESLRKYAQHDDVIKFPISKHYHVFNTPTRGQTDFTLLQAEV
jgi:DNA-binding transcriptional regulator YhcF (GntR family)